MRPLALTLAIAAGPLWADSPPLPDAPPTAGYRSAFHDYKPLQEPPLRDWQQANGEVARLRGHMGHLAPDGQRAAPAAAHAHPAKAPAADERR